MTELPESYKLTTITTRDQSEREIVIVVDTSVSDWIQSVQKSIRRHESRKVIRGRNRNAQCPCGCGAKAKRCKKQ